MTRVEIMANETPGVLMLPNPNAPVAREASVKAELDVRTNNEANSQGSEVAAAAKQPQLGRRELQVAQDMISRLEEEVRKGNTGKAVLDLLASYKNKVNPSQESPTTSAKPVQARGGERTIATDERTGESDNPEGHAVGTARGSGEAEGASGKPLSAEEQERQAGGNPAANANRELTEKSQIKKKIVYIPLGFLPFWALYKGYRWLSPKTGIPQLVREVRRVTRSLAEFVGTSYAEGIRLREEHAARKQSARIATGDQTTQETTPAQGVEQLPTQTPVPKTPTVTPETTTPAGTVATSEKPASDVATRPTQEKPVSSPPDAIARGLKQLTGYGVTIVPGDTPDTVMDRINEGITTNNNTPGATQQPLWQKGGEVGQQNSLFIQPLIDSVNKQPTGQQKT